MLQVLLINGLVLAMFFVVVGAACISKRDVTPVDAAWASGMVVLAVSSAFVADGDSARRLLLTALCAAWGLRLAIHLLVRWRRQGTDRRYVAILGKAQKQKGWSFGRAAVQLVFLMQAPLLFVVCLPVQLGQIDDTPGLGVLSIIGTAVAVVGIAFETVADRQLVLFRRDPTSAGRVLDSGLWRYTRHPNYFGDACTWWGLYLIAAETSTGRWALPGPIFLTWTLVKWSGKPMLEYKLRQTRPAYAAYIERTPSFVPWFPKAERSS